MANVTQSGSLVEREREGEMACAAMSRLMNFLTLILLEKKNKYIIRETEDQAWSLLCMLKRLRPFVRDIQRNQNPEIGMFMKELVDIINEVGSDNRPERSFEITKSKLKLWHNCCFSRTSPSTASSSVFVFKDEDDDMVRGLEKEVTMMIERLNDEDPRCDVIPIVGPGGVGKTQLAQRVFNHPSIVENFPCRVWISAYNQSDLSIKKLLQGMVDQLSPLPPPLTTVEEEENKRGEKRMIRDLAIRIYNHLKTNRYLVVFDDVFRTQFWADINMIFPNYKNRGGGRIIFTTRYDEVALFWKAKKVSDLSTITYQQGRVFDNVQLQRQR